MAIVNTPRETRVERARQTRRRMIGAARELFVAQGFAATTMDQIAASAGVAVQTLYYTFQTKARLLSEVVEVTAAGQEMPPSPRGQPAWVQEMVSAATAHEVLAAAIEHGAAIYERVAVLWPALAAAASADASIDDYWRGVTARRRGGQRAMVARIAELGDLRPHWDVERATDLVVVLFGHDVYRGLVQEAGWTVTAYKAWLFSTLVEQLLVPPERVGVESQAGSG